MIKWILLISLVIINVVTFAMYGADKMKAQAGAWRIPEKTLLGLAAIGGSLGAFAGMQFFHHKTKHLNFQIIVPLCLVIHAAILGFLSNKGIL